jgi:hypothetical protein
MRTPPAIAIAWLLSAAAVSTLAADPPATPPSMAGQPFALSASIRKSCESAPDQCAQVYALLDQLAAEARDAGWASNMERSLTDYMASQGRDFSIRALECRTTVCAAEVTSPRGSEVHAFHYGAPIDRVLQPAAGINAYERNESGDIMTLSLRLYSRR